MFVFLFVMCDFVLATFNYPVGVTFYTIALEYA